MALMLTSCTVLDTLLPTVTPVLPTATLVPSATIVWFPPTETSTPRTAVTVLPTQEMRPGLGSTVLTDDFSRAALWDTASSDMGSAAVEEGRLTLAAQPGVYLLSFRSGAAYGDFYAEITARPSLCRDNDEYGLLVRGRPVAYYRFALTCNGTARADRISVDTRRPLQEAIPSADVPPGAPGEVRIGVWAAGTELRLFLNGRFQFSIEDANYLSGGIGVFARSAGDTPVAVSFSDLEVREVDYVPAPASETPAP